MNVMPHTFLSKINHNVRDGKVNLQIKKKLLRKIALSASLNLLVGEFKVTMHQAILH